MPALRSLVKDTCARAVMLALLMVVGLHFFALSHLSDKTIQRPPEAVVPIILPHMAPTYYEPLVNSPFNQPGTFLYRFTLDYRFYNQTIYILNPKGCIQRITINTINIPFDTSHACDYNSGVPVNFMPGLTEGANAVTIELSNAPRFWPSYFYQTSTYALFVAPVIFHRSHFALSDILGCILIAACCAALIRFVYRLTNDYTGGMILSLGFLAYVRHLSVTSFMHYVIDMPSHLQYIAFIATNGFWPKPYAGWQYYHPPLYYQLEAWVMLFGNWLGSFDAIALMRIFSLGGFLLFLLFSLLSLRRLIANNYAYYASLLLLVCFPTGIIYATRLDAHSIFYPAYAACSYFLLRWIMETRLRDFGYALICFGIAIASRSNALSLAPLILAAMLYQWRNKTFRLRDLVTPFILFASSVVLLGCLGNFGRMAYYHIVEHNTMPYLVGNINSVQRSQIITNSFEHFFFLDIDKLFYPPFLDWWHDTLGRQYFWNSLLKTALFEHFTWPIRLARILMLGMLLIICYLATGSQSRRIKTLPWKLCVTALAIPIATLMLNRISHPFAPSQDFRYIYPALVPFCGLAGIVIDNYYAQKQPLQAQTGIVLIALFSLCSLPLILRIPLPF